MTPRFQYSTNGVANHRVKRIQQVEGRLNAGFRRPGHFPFTGRALESFYLKSRLF